MQRQQVNAGQALRGTERYGAVHGTEVAAIMPSHIQPGTEPAPPSGTRYGILSQCTAMKANGDQCGAPQKRGSDFCVGHTRRFQKMLKEQEAEKTKETASVIQE